MKWGLVGGFDEWNFFFVVFYEFMVWILSQVGFCISDWIHVMPFVAATDRLAFSREKNRIQAVEVWRYLVDIFIVEMG